MPAQRLGGHTWSTGLFVSLAYLALTAFVSSDDTQDVSASGHWAFQPVSKALPPHVTRKAWVTNDIDRFVLGRLEQEGLTPSSQAARYTLIRRLTFDLTGLPPNFSDAENFSRDDSPDAYTRLLDRLLASPRYGERWGRHWLDVARYADTRGHTFDGREKRFPYSYTYRDYVIQSFNGDRPYDRFVMEQIAADQLVAKSAKDRSALAALGFLTLGRHFLGDEYDTIDDRIDVVTRGLMGLTVSCARCHNHKFDPIPTEDYYSLYGVFASSFVPELAPLLGEPEETKEYAAFKAEYEKRRKKRDDYVRQRYEELLHDLRSQTGEYLARIVKEVAEGKKLVKAEATVLVAPDDVRAPVVERWRTYLNQTATQRNPVFTPWHALAKLPNERFAAEALTVLSNLMTSSTTPVNPRVAERLVQRKPLSMEEVGRLYGELFAEIEEQWRSLRAENPSASGLAEKNAETLRQALYGPGTPTALTLEEATPLFHHGHIVRIRQLTGGMESLETDGRGAPPRAMALLDRPTPVEPVVFERGDPLRPGAKVPRRFLRAIGEPGATPFTRGSGRLELALAIASADNPLTARVFVNWVWMHHFGNAIVPTPGNFGALGQPPSHPKLLDYLAATFIEEGWSIKRLHRQILLSSTYRQSSKTRIGRDAETVQSVDPENRLLWRIDRRRLEFEALRDAMISVTGRLDSTMGGKPFELNRRPFSPRRTVYVFLDRQNLPAEMRTFDFAAPESTNHERPRTTVPQQALFLMNSPFVIEQARHLAKRAKKRIRAMYRFVYAKEPTPAQLALATAFIESSTGNATGSANADATDPPQRPLTAWEDLAQALLLSNQFMFVD